MTDDELDKYVRSIQPITDLTPGQQRDIEDLILHRGMRPLLGLLLAERQGYYMQLANWRVKDMEGAQHLGVLQGRANGIDRIRDVLIECTTVPTETKE